MRFSLTWIHGIRQSAPQMRTLSPLGPTVSRLKRALFVSPNENTFSSLVSERLIGSWNYISWKKSIEMVLDLRHKAGFVKGRIPKPTDETQLEEWKRCIRVILSWLLSSVSSAIWKGLVHCEEWRLHSGLAGVGDQVCLFQWPQELCIAWKDCCSETRWYERRNLLRWNEDPLGRWGSSDWLEALRLGSCL